MIDYDKRTNNIRIEKSEILDAIGVQEILDYFGQKEFLEAIGEKDCADFFGLKAEQD